MACVARCAGSLLTARPAWAEAPAGGGRGWLTSVPEPVADPLCLVDSSRLSPDSSRDAVRGQPIHVDCDAGDSALGDAHAIQARLSKPRVPCEYHEFRNGHDWGYWRTHLAQSLEAVARGMR